MEVERISQPLHLTFCHHPKMPLSTTALMAQDAASTLENGTRAIALNPETLQQLNSLVASAEALRQAGYVVKTLTDDELEQKKRCLTCGVRRELRAISTKSGPPVQD
jgi:hypothetical protein